MGSTMWSNHRQVSGKRSEAMRSMVFDRGRRTGAPSALPVQVFWVCYVIPQSLWKGTAATVQPTSGPTTSGQQRAPSPATQLLQSLMRKFGSTRHFALAQKLSSLVSGINLELAANPAFPLEGRSRNHLAKHPPQPPHSIVSLPHLA